MPKRIISEFSEVPVGMLFKSEDDDCIYIKYSELTPELHSDAVFNVRQRAEDMKQELRLLHMVLGDEEWQRIFAREQPETPAEVSPEVAAGWPFPIRVPNSE